VKEEIPKLKISGRGIAEGLRLRFSL